MGKNDIKCIEIDRKMDKIGRKKGKKAKSGSGTYKIAKTAQKSRIFLCFHISIIDFNIFYAF
jgi:hypothetical protein